MERIGVFLLLLLPMFLFGFAGGLWCKRVRTVIFAGCIIGFLPIVILLVLDLRSTARFPLVVDWGMVALQILIFVVPAVLGSLAGAFTAAMTSQQRPIGLTLLVCFVAIIVPLLVFPPIHLTPEKSPRTVCLINLKQIGLALALYAADYNWHLPTGQGVEGLNRVYPRFIASLKPFHCPADKIRHEPKAEPLTEANCSYVYAGGIWQGMTEMPICWDKPGNHKGGLCVLFNDGHAAWLSSNQWTEIQRRMQ